MLYAMQQAPADQWSDQAATAIIVLATITEFLKQFHFVRRLSQVSSYLLEFVIANVFVVLFRLGCFFFFIYFLVASCLLLLCLYKISIDLERSFIFNSISARLEFMQKLFVHQHGKVLETLPTKTKATTTDIH